MKKLCLLFVVATRAICASDIINFDRIIQRQKMCAGDIAACRHEMTSKNLSLKNLDSISKNIDVEKKKSCDFVAWKENEVKQLDQQSAILYHDLLARGYGTQEWISWHNLNCKRKAYINLPLDEQYRQAAWAQSFGISHPLHYWNMHVDISSALFEKKYGCSAQDLESLHGALVANFDMKEFKKLEKDQCEQYHKQLSDLQQEVLLLVAERKARLVLQNFGRQVIARKKNVAMKTFMDLQAKTQQQKVNYDIAQAMIALIDEKVFQVIADNEKQKKLSAEQIKKEEKRKKQREVAQAQKEKEAAMQATREQEKKDKAAAARQRQIAATAYKKAQEKNNHTADLDFLQALIQENNKNIQQEKLQTHKNELTMLQAAPLPSKTSKATALYMQNAEQRAKKIVALAFAHTRIATDGLNQQFAASHLSFIHPNASIANNAYDPIDQMDEKRNQLHLRVQEIKAKMYDTCMKKNG